MDRKRKALNSKRRMRAMEDGKSSIDGSGKVGQGDQDHITFVRKNRANVFTDRKKERDKNSCRRKNNYSTE